MQEPNENGQLSSEEFYGLLENSVKELTIDYAQKLRGIGEDLLHEVSTTVFDEEELEQFIQTQEKRFYEQMQGVIDDIRKKIVDSANVNHEVKDLHLRDRLKVSVIGITETKGKFIQMPKGTTIINANCKLLLVGSQKGIARSKRIINLKNKPEDI